jgi:hypothetical protein
MGITVRAEHIGPTGNIKFHAYVKGSMLRTKTGVGRVFKTEQAAQKAAQKVLKLNPVKPSSSRVKRGRGRKTQS